MARVIVTQELADTLRSIRIQNKIQAKLLANHINKSPAYISKLENGNIQTIDNNELYDILKFIIGDAGNYDEIAERIYASLKFKYTKKEIEEQVWFTNFDTVERSIPIPNSLIEDLNNKITQNDISIQRLLERINANEALDDDEINDPNIPYNQWYHQKKLGDSAQSIKILMTESQLCNILDGKTDVTAYVFIFCIAFYILKIESFGDNIHLSNDENKELMSHTTDYLNSHKFLSIAAKDQLLSERQNREEIEDILSTFDLENIEIVNEIISGFRFASECNIKKTNYELKKFSENMKWDLGFMMRILSLDFKALDNTSISNRRVLITEIEKLIEKYQQLPDEQNQIETY